MTIYRGPGGTGTATSDSDTTEFQEFVVDAQAARDAALAAQTAAELAETNAETAETNAETAETNAETAATNAASSASSAASSASSASSSASSASTSASNASSSASSASTSASAASSSASAASTSASNAATSATNAASSATAAASSATSASSSASTATTQATNAAASASAASTSASSASAAQTAAEAARDAALSAYDNFDDRYLGPKSSDPTLDNDGNALLTGALYFNTASNVMKVYTGSSWVAAYVSAAGVLLAANNLSDVASTATSRTNLNVPTRTGGDASGTWGIDITGNAATATTATSATSATSATTATNVSGGTASVTSITDSGNLTFTGTGNRITGDFSNATLANRVAFQTSTTNGPTQITAMPNGTSTQSQFTAVSGTDLNNANGVQIRATSTEAAVMAYNTGSASALPMTFYTGGSERMRVDTSGNVGIGTSSPSVKLEVKAGNGNQLVLDNAGETYTQMGFKTNGISRGAIWATATDFSLYTYSTQPIIFYTNTAERARIDSSGNVLIGDTSAAGTGLTLGNGKDLWFKATGYNTWKQVNYQGGLYWNNGSDRVVIDSSGNLLVGTTTSGGWNANAIFESKKTTAGSAVSAYFASNNGGQAILCRVDGTTPSLINFFSSTTNVGSITSNGTTTAYNTSSDYRLKHDIAPMTGALAKVALLKPCTYKWNADGSDGEGFIAHELAEVVPQCVTGEKDAVDADGNPRYQGIDTSFLVATLTAAIQEQQALIASQSEIINAQQAALTALTARVTALETN